MVGRLALAALAGVIAVAGCGDDDDGGAVDAATPVADARPGTPDGPRADAPLPSPDAPAGADAAAADASGVDADPGQVADLKADSITRDAPYYRVRYCNVGDATAEGMFRVRITNVSTSETFETPPFFAVPAPGECAETGGITCGLIGDTACNLRGDVFGFVDSSNAIPEGDETNNQIVVTF
jgi:hypothetical protein